MKAINKRIFLVIIYAIILIAYFSGFLVVFNIKRVLGIGQYYGQKDFSIILNGTECGLDVEIYAYHRSYYDHYYGYTITAFSSGDVELEGITYLFYRVEAHGGLYQFLDMDYNPPIISHSVDSLMLLYQNDNLTINGYANITFNIDGINENHRIPMELGIIIELDGEQINYEWGNLGTWLNTIYLSCSVLPMTLLYRNIKKIRFEKWYGEEFELRDKKFFNTLSNKKKPKP